MIRLTVAAIFMVCAACSPQESSKQSAVPDHWFQVGEIVPDLRPIIPTDSTDLREFALALPILEVRTQETYDWIYEESSSALTSQEWRLPADGAQAPVTIYRMSNTATGAQRIRVVAATWIPIPDRSQNELSAILERLDKGWRVVDSRAD